MNTWRFLKPYANFDVKIRDCININSLRFKNLSNNTKYLPIGNLQSYGEICIPGIDSVAITTNRLKKININKDEMSVIVSSNVTVGELMLSLEEQGYYIKVYPGGCNVTVGGCVAADAHGKSSHKYGTFGNHIKNILIFDFNSSNKVLLSHDDLLFKYTISGFGATGIILEVSIRIYKIPGKSFQIDSIKVNTPKELIGKLINICETNDDVAGWFSVQENRIYSKIIYAKWCQRESLRRKNLLVYLFPIAFAVLGMKFFYKISYRLLAYYIYNKNDSACLTQFQTTFPLNDVKGWKYLFGFSFIERQFLIDFNSADIFFDELLCLMKIHKINSPFCAIKIFNGERVGLMSFARAGISFNILYRSNEIIFSRKLSVLLEKFKAPEYLAKSSKKNTTFPKNYDDYDLWINFMKEKNISTLYFE